MTTLRPTISFLGAGSMGSSILQGLLSGGFESASIRVTNRTDASAAAREWPEPVTSLSLESNPRANLDAVEGADIVVIGVKPHMVADLLREVAPALAEGAIVVSLAAAVSTSVMEAALPGHVAVVRTMPNTPTAVGLGVTALSRGTRTSDEQLALVERMFAAVGAVLVVDESRMEAVTGVSGSGPAYVYYMVESFIRGAEAQGFTPEEAETLVLQTFRGALEMLRVSGKSPQQLRRDVTSPNGTTERAIAVLQEADLPAVLTAAVEASAARSRELSQG
ncbi:pyrroline-5-carboxylate reductase [Salinibacterium sp. dk2585]|uniref:pyrroline-5-carboxylate reductase n=1 Tax=unclassified Salinibacterium TaxID=2632331 RepID=UPI0011C24472|nr:MULTISPECIES: pyrroline-5-carboxylate reductase [unclassified Salinibacterium]QEE62371.1 pyrroline-5-carboxylate reductase [Salinibacterium sp. dk2585]TXK52746.1 pyrroline-5-carboxylate reductase [Salinibacterium sp. dk5596]